MQHCWHYIQLNQLSCLHILPQFGNCSIGGTNSDRNIQRDTTITLRNDTDSNYIDSKIKHKLNICKMAKASIKSITAM